MHFVAVALIAVCDACAAHCWVCVVRKCLQLYVGPSHTQPPSYRRQAHRLAGEGTSVKLDELFTEIQFLRRLMKTEIVYTVDLKSRAGFDCVIEGELVWVVSCTLSC